MSVSVEPPLHFTQQSPPPPFSSTSPQSPSRLHHIAPASPSPPPVNPDMSASVATDSPASQRHDRQDADMSDDVAPPPQTAADIPPAANHNPPPTQVAVAVESVDQDAMDTSPDADQSLLAQADGQGDAPVAPASPGTTDAAQAEPSSTDEAPPAPPADTTDAAVSIPPPPPDENSQPPPPPPVDPPQDDSESSDDEDGVQSWHPIQEDTSSPDEDELKEIESTTEYSALDHQHWENKAFPPVTEPEYTVGPSGRLHWAIDAYNGTRENPNRDIVMMSDPITVGGHQWRIKFYPKGNDSDYLSVYLECLSVMDNGGKPKAEEGDDASKEPSTASTEPSTASTEPSTVSKEPSIASNETIPADDAPATPPSEMQHTPLPLLDAKKMPKRKSIAAQVSVVLYNPSEPRVNYCRTALHRFCGGSPDWGWTRFHGPYYEIAHRSRGQRQALLRDDKLAFTGYIRVVEDETDGLWEHPSGDNQWDSFAMTGLQGLMLGEDASAPGGNMISAVASWMLFKPFRDLLYSIKTPLLQEEPFARPLPLVNALQSVLYKLRTRVEPGAGPVALDCVLNTLEWYGIHGRIDKLDVMETWEVLRAKLEEELQNTPHSSALQTMFGSGTQPYSPPSFRVPVVGVETMQNAVDKAETPFPHSRPQLLCIELARQEFDQKTRSYDKLMNKVTLDDHISVGGTQYTLYGHVVHKQTLQSYVYQPILRPGGPGSKWYSYSDSKDQNQVKCLTRREAVEDHEGKPGSDRIVGNDAVAYIAMYVRNDVSRQIFTASADSEPWDVPEWIKQEAAENKLPSSDSSIPPPPPPGEPAAAAPDEGTVDETEPAKVIDFSVIDSRLFAQHQGSGILDIYNPKWQGSNHIHRVQISTKDDCKTIREKLASVLDDVKDPRQVKFWMLDSLRGSLGRPALQGTGKIEFSSGSYDRYSDQKEWNIREAPTTSRILWAHVLDFASLPEPPVEEPKSTEVHEESTTVEMVPEPAPAVDVTSTEPEVNITPIEPQTVSEDTPMSDPVESDLDTAQPSIETISTEATDVSNDQQTTDTAMEVEASSQPDPPAVDVIIADPVSVTDTEMGGTREEALPPPPPPQFEAPTEPAQPPPPPRTPTPDPPADEVYFFLKYFDAERQVLEPKGSHIVPRSARVDETVTTLLGMPLEDKKKLDIWEEEELATTRILKHRRTFSQLDLHNATVLIVSLPVPDETRATLASRAAFSDPESYLAFLSFARNFPHKLTGHFTQSYFSAQYYKGEITNSRRHGVGTLIYHSGATYTGAFRLGKRHGHGLHVFQNGDTYEGEWVDDAQHGMGTFVEAATGNTYAGGWRHDKKFGEGVTHWKNAQEAERLCRICWEDGADAVFYDCGHVVACLQCAREVQNCPVCRKRVLCALKLYYVA